MMTETQVERMVEFFLNEIEKIRLLRDQQKLPASTILVAPPGLSYYSADIHGVFHVVANLSRAMRVPYILTGTDLVLSSLFSMRLQLLANDDFKIEFISFEVRNTKISADPSLCFVRHSQRKQKKTEEWQERKNTTAWHQVKVKLVSYLHAKSVRPCYFVVAEVPKRVQTTIITWNGGRLEP